jgi:hypothetical protein
MKLRHKRKLHNNVRLLRSLRRTLAQVFRASFNVQLDSSGTTRWFGTQPEEKALADVLIDKMKSCGRKIKK